MMYFVQYPENGEMVVCRLQKSLKRAKAKATNKGGVVYDEKRNPVYIPDSTVDRCIRVLGQQSRRHLSALNGALANHETVQPYRRERKLRKYVPPSPHPETLFRVA